MKEFEKTEDYDLIWEAYTNREITEEGWDDWSRKERGLAVGVGGGAFGAIVGQHVGGSFWVKLAGAITGALVGAGAGTLVAPGPGTAIGGLGGGGLGWLVTAAAAPTAFAVMGAIGGYLIGNKIYGALKSGEMTEEEAIAQAQQELDSYSDEEKARLPRVEPTEG